MPAQNPADLPSYKHPDYQKMSAVLQLLHDVYNNLQDCKDAYLPKAQKEPEQAFEARVKRSVFNNKTRLIIDSNAGLLTAFDVSGAPSTLEAAQSNVDMRGSDLKSFVFKANVMGLRDHCCYVLTMQDDVEGERTAADDIESPRRPCWKLIDRRNVLNWRVAYEGEQLVIEQVTLLMYEDVADGAYGLKAEPRYHVLKRVDGAISHRVFSIEQTNGVEAAVLIEERVVPIPRIPLTPYPDVADPFPVGIPEFLKAAELNLKLFRQESTLDNIQYRVNAPTFWRRSRLDLGDRPPFIAGENYVIELYAADGVHGDDEVGVLEISGEGIAALQQSAEETKTDIEAEGLGFISGARVQRTATETYLSGAQVSASLNGKARQISSALQRMAEDWCLFTGEDASQFAIEMDHSLLEMPLDAQEMAQLLGLWQSGAIDHRTLLELLRMGRQLPPSADIDLILERVAEEVAQQTAAPNISNGVMEE